MKRVTTVNHGFEKWVRRVLSNKTSMKRSMVSGEILLISMSQRGKRRNSRWVQY
jgi:hypothetical protein